MPADVIYWVHPRLITDFEETFRDVARAGIPAVALHTGKMGDLDLEKPEDACSPVSIS